MPKEKKSKCIIINAIVDETITDINEKYYALSYKFTDEDDYNYEGILIFDLIYNCDDKKFYLKSFEKDDNKINYISKAGYKIYLSEYKLKWILPSDILDEYNLEDLIRYADRAIIDSMI